MLTIKTSPKEVTPNYDSNVGCIDDTICAWVNGLFMPIERFAFDNTIAFIGGYVGEPIPVAVSDIKAYGTMKELHDYKQSLIK